MDRNVSARTRTGALSALLLAGGIALPTVLAAQQGGGQGGEDSPYRIEEIVVTASGFEQDVSQAPASITVLNREELRLQRSNDLSEALMTVEGIDVGGSRGKTGGLNISIRGMPSDYTLILVDGRRQNAAGNVTPNGFGETSSSFLPPVNSIERIEVIRGPMATLYGSDGMGGVINIITRKVGSRWTGSASTDATVQTTEGWGNTYSGNFALNGPLVEGRLGLNLQGSLLRRESSDLRPTGEFGEEVSISSRGPSPVRGDIRSVGGRLNFTPAADHLLTLEFDLSRQFYDNTDGQLGTLDTPHTDPPRFGGYGPRQDFNRDRYVLAYGANLGIGRFDLSASRNTTETIGRTIPAGTPGGLPGSGAPPKETGSPRTLESTNDILDAKLVRTLGAHTLSVGGQLWSAEMIDGVALQPFTYEMRSLYSEDEWRLHPAVRLTAGLRYDSHSSFGSHLSPRGYLVWNMNPRWTVKGGISGGYRTPRVEQLQDGIIGFTGQGRTATIGSPHLKPETSVTTEMGLHYGASSGWSGGLSLFQNRFDDKITSGTPIPNCTFEGAPNVPGCVDYGNFPTQEFFGQSQNVDEAITRGAEFNLRVPFGIRWSLMTNYTYTESEQKSGPNEGWPLTNTPKHMVNGNLQGRPIQGLNVWLRGEYRSSRVRRTSAGENPAWEQLGDYRAWELFHLGAGYEVMEGVTINATIYNLLDRDFLTYASYQGTPTTANPTGIQYTSLYNNHQEGRRFWISTTLQF